MSYRLMELLLESSVDCDIADTTLTRCAEISIQSGHLRRNRAATRGMHHVEVRRYGQTSKIRSLDEGTSRVSGSPRITPYSDRPLLVC